MSEDAPAYGPPPPAKPLDLDVIEASLRRHHPGPGEPRTVVAQPVKHGCCFDAVRLLRLARAAEALLASGVVLEHDSPRLLSPISAAKALRAMGDALEGREP